MNLDNSVGKIEIQLLFMCVLLSTDFLMKSLTTIYTEYFDWPTIDFAKTHVTGGMF